MNAANRSADLRDEITRLPLKEGMRVFPKGWTGDMNRKYQMSDAWSQAVIVNWEKAGRAEIVRRGRRWIGLRMASDSNGTEPSKPAPDEVRSLRDKVLAMMQSKADDKGRIHVSTDEMRREMGLSPHDFIKGVWDLQKQGMLTFRQTGSGSSANLINYRLRNYERHVVPGDAVPSNVMDREWSICPDCWNTRKTHRWENGDRDRLVCPDPQPDSPLWLTRRKAKAEQVEPDVTPKSAPSKPGYVTCEECGSSFIDKVALQLHTKMKHTPLVVGVKPSISDVPVEDRAKPQPIDWSLFPALTQMVNRYNARAEALSALTKAGEEDLASLLRTQIGSDTDLPLIEQVTLLLTTLGYNS
jgi:hypothetical protein